MGKVKSLLEDVEGEDQPHPASEDIKNYPNKRKKKALK